MPIVLVLTDGLEGIARCITFPSSVDFLLFDDSLVLLQRIIVHIFLLYLLFSLPTVLALVSEGVPAPARLYPLSFYHHCFERDIR